MPLEDYLPNVFGGVNPQIAGLLGDEQAGLLRKQSNVAGLLGAAAALAQGMSPAGYRRSAAQNILTALGAGFQNSAASNEQGLKNIVQQQQISQTLNQQAAIINLLKDPKIANDPAAVAFIRANPADAIKMYAERSAFDSQVEALKNGRNAAQPAPAVGTSTGGMPGVEVTGNGEIASLESDIQDNLIRAQVAARMNKPQDAKLYTDRAEALKKRQSNLSVQSFDFAELKKSLPEQFHPQVNLLQKAAESGDLTGYQLLQNVEAINNGVREYAKGMKLDGLNALFAQGMFGTSDMSKLTQPQIATVLRFANAPDADKQAQLEREGIRTNFETGVKPRIPTSREQMLGGMATPFNAGQPVVEPAPQQVVSPSQPQTVAQNPATQPLSPQVQVQPQPAKPKQQIIPMVEQPDSKVPPKKKQELIAAQPSTIELGKYTVQQIASARAAAMELKNNPAYLDAITADNPAKGVQVAAASRIKGTDAYTAGQLLGNLNTRGFVTELQRMRSASPTGGAVGSVAVAEMNALGNVQAQLNPGMKRAEFERQLDKYIQNADRALANMKLEYSRTYGYRGEFDDLINNIQPMDLGLPAGVTVTRKKQ